MASGSSNNGPQNSTEAPEEDAAELQFPKGNDKVKCASFIIM
jgi:hypothetical protein